MNSGPLPDSARQEIEAILTPSEFALFSRFSPADQWHSYRVFSSLSQQGETDRPLLAAALLHDVGKTTCDTTMWDRSLVVAVEKVWPSRIEAWGSGPRTGWRRPFAFRQQHAAWGAELAEAAGSDESVVRLIANHQILQTDTLSAQETRWLDALRKADDQH